MNILKNILVLCLSIFFLILGLCKIFIERNSYADTFGSIAQMARNSSPWLLKFIGILEVVGALGLLCNFGSSSLKTVSIFAGVCLIVHMVLAMAAHIARNDSLLVTTFPIFIGFLCALFVVLELKT